MKNGYKVATIILSIALIIGILWFVGFSPLIGEINKLKENNQKVATMDEKTDEQSPEASASAETSAEASASPSTSVSADLSVEDAVQWAEKGWEKETKDDLTNWQICDGDVEVDISKEQANKLKNKDESKDVDKGQKFFTFYDEGGEGQCTLIVNISSKPISVYSAWAAGRINLTESFDLKKQIDYVMEKEWDRQIDGKNLFHEIRVVVIQDDSIKQYFITREQKTITLDK